MSVSSLKNDILPSVFNKNGAKLLECDIDSKYFGEDQFQSSVVFLTATVEKESVLSNISLVVKFEPFDAKFRTYLGTNLQFYNEVVMYSEVLPYLNRLQIVDDLFPRFYYGKATLGDSTDSVVVLEDLRPKGFKLADAKCYIDYELLSLAMKHLGRFHALSYAAKKESSEEFDRLVGKLEETTWRQSNQWLPIISATVHRAVDPLIKKGKHVQVLTALLKLVDGDVIAFTKQLVAPREPLAVLCHGDFCRNNVLFRYGPDGQPRDIRFFDVATSRYSSLAIDITFFLLLNSTPELRRDRLDDLLATYHEALSSAVPGTEVPSLDQVRKEYIQKALYGFLHCSFFLPMMLFGPPEDPTVTEEVMASIGGEEGTAILSDMVEEMIKIGCLTMENEIFKKV